MNNETWTAVIAAVAALVGALGSQAVAGRASLKSRRLDLYFDAKSKAYAGLLERLGEFAFDPKDLRKYLRFLSAFEQARLFASSDVLEALQGKNGLHANAQRLRVGDPIERENVAISTWHDAVKTLTTAMHNDLKRLSNGLQ